MDTMIAELFIANPKAVSRRQVPFDLLKEILSEFHMISEDIFRKNTTKVFFLRQPK